jgi:tetratricopeptide (TPR) repeat protein
MRSSVFAVSVLAGLALASMADRAQASSSSDELVRQARAHEAAHEDDLAVRRYMEALSIDPTSEEAWLGLGALRMRSGDAGEADRVYAAALERVPGSRRALLGRARARWFLGHHADAERDLEAYAKVQPDAPALRELSEWYGADGRGPAQLAVWRRILVLSSRREDVEAEREARRMVRALIVIVDGADPASSPVDPDATRRALAAIARRGG